MSYSIRPLQAEDIDEMVTLSVAAYQEFADHLTPQDWEQMRRGIEYLPQLVATGVGLLAVEDQRIVGSVVYIRPGQSDPRLFPVEWASIRMLAVAPTERGHGIGRMLTEACITQARQDGATYIGLHTSDLMDVARGMYQRMGFREDGELPRFFNRAYWRYVLALTPSND